MFVGPNNKVGKKVHFGEFGAILGQNGLHAYGASGMDVFGVLKRVSTHVKNLNNEVEVWKCADTYT